MTVRAVQQRSIVKLAPGEKKQWPSHVELLSDTLKNLCLPTISSLEHTVCGINLGSSDIFMLQRNRFLGAKHHQYALFRVLRSLQVLL